MAAKIIGLLLVGVGWYWFLFSTPGGLPVPGQAYRDQEHAFALVQPEGWQLKKMKDCRKSGGYLGLTPDICVVLQLQDVRGASQSGPFVQVTKAPISSLFKTGWGGSVRITNSSKDEIARELERGIAAFLPGYKNETSELVPIDNVSSVRVLGSASIKGYPIVIGDSVVTVPSLSGNTPERIVTMGGVLVPGGSHAYLITYGCEKAEYQSLGRTFDDVVGSFRITEGRSTPFQAYGGLWGSLTGDLILGALVGLTLILFKVR